MPRALRMQLQAADRLLRRRTARKSQLEALCRAHPRRGIPTVRSSWTPSAATSAPPAENYAREAFERYQADCGDGQPVHGPGFDRTLSALDRPRRDSSCAARPIPAGRTCSSYKRKPANRCICTSPAWSPDKWNSQQQCGLVVGATYPAELAAVRKRVGGGVPC